MNPTARLALLSALSLCLPLALAAQQPAPPDTTPAKVQALPDDPEADLPVANPARPTVSTPATLTPIGYLQFENGVIYGTNSPEFHNRVGVNQVTKLTLDSRAQLLVLFEPYTYANGAKTGVAVNGQRPGEVFAGMQVVLIPGKDKRPTVSAQYLRRLYASPAPEFDLGTFVQDATILVSDDLFGFHFDVNGLFIEQQDDNTKVRQIQFAQTLSISHPIGKFTISGELWHFAQPLTNSRAVGNLYCASYPLKPNLVVDFGMQKGLTSTSTRFEGFAGLTYVLPHRFWKPRHG